MFVAIIGGNLQGVEAVYLAKKAGWDVLLIDKNAEAAASLMCDRFLPLRIRTERDLNEIPKQVDLVIPAIEDDRVLALLMHWSRKSGIPVAFDADAYAISSSKRKSNQLFKALGIPVPTPWPECGFPIMVKPDEGSGSQGVRRLDSEPELKRHFPTASEFKRMVVQEYLEGPSYSIEVVGSPGNYLPLQVTELHMDRNHDCCRVSAPVGLDSAQIREFEHIAVRIAERLRLRGVMDAEAIHHDGELKTLEIDARLPSQTPTVVFHSAGVNMLQLLADLFLAGNVQLDATTRPKAAIYEHVQVTDGRIEVKGEHIVSGIGPLSLHPGLFGADEAITNCHPGRDHWAGTLIFHGDSVEDVLDRQRRTYENIRDDTNRPSGGPN